MLQNDGFSFVEIMISLIIFTIGILAFASLNISLIRANSLSKQKIYALNLTLRKMEQLKQMGYKKLTPGYFKENLDRFNIGKLSREWEIKFNSPLPGTAFLKVTTKWTNFTKNHQMQLSTLISE